MEIIYYIENSKSKFSFLNFASYSFIIAYIKYYYRKNKLLCVYKISVEYFQSYFT